VPLWPALDSRVWLPTSLTRLWPLLRYLKSRRAGAAEVILVIFAKQPDRTIGEKPPKASTPLPELQGDSPTRIRDQLTSSPP